MEINPDLSKHSHLLGGREPNCLQRGLNCWERPPYALEREFRNTLQYIRKVKQRSPKVFLHLKHLKLLCISGSWEAAVNTSEFKIFLISSVFIESNIWLEDKTSEKDL